MEEEKKTRSKWIFALMTFICLLILWFITALLGEAVLKIPYFLAFGWIYFIKNNLSRMQFGGDMVLSGLLGWAAALWLMHSFCRWIMKEKGGEWRFAQSLRLNGLVLVMFVASCALVGFVHQVIWLANKDIVVNQSRRSIDKISSMNQMKQLYLILADYEFDQGVMPDTLYDLVRKGYIQDTYSKSHLFYANHEGKKEPWLYFGKGKQSADNSVILASPFIYRGHLVYLQADGLVKDRKLKEGKAGEEEYRTFLETGLWHQTTE